MEMRLDNKGPFRTRSWAHPLLIIAAFALPGIPLTLGRFVQERPAKLEAIAAIADPALIPCLPQRSEPSAPGGEVGIELPGNDSATAATVEGLIRSVRARAAELHAERQAVNERYGTTDPEAEAALAATALGRVLDRVLDCAREEASLLAKLELLRSLQADAPETLLGWRLVGIDPVREADELRLAELEAARDKVAADFLPESVWVRRAEELVSRLHERASRRPSDRERSRLDVANPLREALSRLQSELRLELEGIRAEITVGRQQVDSLQSRRQELLSAMIEARHLDQALDTTLRHLNELELRRFLSGDRPPPLLPMTTMNGGEQDDASVVPSPTDNLLIVNTVRTLR